MKANAPEKIYLFEGEPILSARSKKRKDANIEYVRTDAFIEKACSCIEELLRGYIIRNFYSGGSYDIDILIEDFKYFMEGE